MDFKNVLMAIVLSTLVLIGWATFFDAPIVEQQSTENQITKNEDLSSPSIDESEKEIKSEITRNDVINNTNRIKVENENIKGSISLQGAIIDDIIFKNYNETLNGENKVIFLNPKNSLIFTKKIDLDDKFLFKITQSIKNNSNKSFQFYPYAQITRVGKPEGMQIYILHEGFLGVFGDELIEKDYDDIEKEKFTINSSKGWLGITDKYWLTAIVPEKGKEFKAEFVAKKEKYRANYIIKEAEILNPGNSITNEINAFVAAKEVVVIDGYAEQLSIEKFDLAIDWGWFYFFTKPLFFTIDYFFRLTGNFGLAIVIITSLVRLIFFPLANYSFKSMAKMKILQPEMVRLKELHKNDKVKLQQETMALYKREKVNPISGCLPVIIQIPFFFAIYKMLYVTLEMRHQPFFGWIKDLSERDPTSVFNLFGLIPWDPPTFLMIGAWPILMGLSMLCFFQFS